MRATLLRIFDELQSMPAMFDIFKPRPEYEFKPSASIKPGKRPGNSIDSMTEAMQGTSLGGPPRPPQRPSKKSPSTSFWNRTFVVPEYAPYTPDRNPNSASGTTARPPTAASRTPSPIKHMPSSPRASSTQPPSPISTPSSSPRKRPGGVQCSGVTSAGKRCTRTVHASSSSQNSSPAGDHVYTQLQNMLSQQDEIPLFCHQHAKQALADDGVYAGPLGVFTRYDGQSSYDTSIISIDLWLQNGYLQTCLHKPEHSCV